MIAQEEIVILIKEKMSSHTRNEMARIGMGSGLTKHACWVLDLLILGKTYDRIKNVLLLTPEMFEHCIEQLYEFLEDFSADAQVSHSFE